MLCCRHGTNCSAAIAVVCADISNLWEIHPPGWCSGLAYAPLGIREVQKSCLDSPPFITGM